MSIHCFAFRILQLAVESVELCCQGIIDKHSTLGYLQTPAYSVRALVIESL